MGAIIRGFHPATPQNLFSFLLDPQKALLFRQNTRFERSTMKIDLFVRAVRVLKKIIKKYNKKGQ
jgi:hypothetical protein